MAGTGAQTWNQATLNIDSRLSNITVGESNGVTTGAGANLLTLKLDGKEFQPDYYRNANSTHYYRINLTDAKSKKSKKKYTSSSSSWRRYIFDNVHCIKTDVNESCYFDNSTESATGC
jgi:hypothetical protein